MPEHIQYEDDDLFNPETHHEESDVPVGVLLWSIVIFVVLSVVSYFVILGFYNYLVRSERNRMDPPRTAVARPATADVPQNQPLLQPFPTVDGKGTPIPPQSNTPVTDLVHMRLSEDQRLKNYGWVDRERGIVHMPIQKAKEVMAAKLAVQGQLGGAVPSGPAGSQPAPASAVSPSGAPVPPDTGVVPPATTTTGGTHQ
ncbi:MAG TPA: hypothetical protein VGF28_23775 [Thermoanaerobaculia bacterium]|jgi:hypothetical protein